MGADIHLYVERLVDGAWQVVVPPKNPKKGEDPWWECFYDGPCYGQYYGNENIDVPCPFTHEALIAAAGAHCVKCQNTGRNLRWYGDRNYDVFGVLAGVRGRCAPIVEPRGCPDDVSDAVRYGNSWDHTPSWYLVSELLAYDWTRHEYCESFTNFVRKWLVPLGPADQVRIVFGFDS